LPRLNIAATLTHTASGTPDAALARRLGGGGGRLSCQCDFVCCDPPEVESLLLDTNMISMIARLASYLIELDNADGDVDDVFRGVLNALRCCGQRPILVAQHQFDVEILGGKRAPFLYAPLSEDLFEEVFDRCEGTPPGRWADAHDADTDRALLASAQASGGATTIVSFDRKVVEWIDEIMVSGECGQVAVIDGIEMLGRATVCLALPEDLFAAANDREFEFLEKRIADPEDGFDVDAAS
jgi:hypothetical protein